MKVNLKKNQILKEEKKKDYNSVFKKVTPKNSSQPGLIC
jgi:hypothetical protein